MVTIDVHDAVPAERLAPWLAANVPATTGTVVVEQLSGGSSNLTFRVQAGDRAMVLRRPPLAGVLPTANDVLREHRVQGALAGTDVPGPTMIAACDDPDVIGSPFYVMELLDGVVYADASSVGHLTHNDARAASLELIDVLARLHAVDPTAVGLGSLGRPEGYLARQLARWQKQWELSKQRELATVDELSRRLEATLPAAPGAAIVHGDYSFNNTMWHRDEPARMLAVLDWEMATQGDPLTDLGMVLTYWGPIGERMWRARGAQPHRASSGFASADELVERYAASSGRDLDHLDFYLVLAAFKLAVISEGARARQGLTDPEGARRTSETVEDVLGLALDVADRSSVPALRGRP